MNPPCKWPQSFLDNFAAAWMAYMESENLSLGLFSKREVVITSFGQTISCLLLNKRRTLYCPKNCLEIGPLFRRCWQANDTHTGERKTKGARGQINEFKYWLLAWMKKKLKKCILWQGHVKIVSYRTKGPCGDLRSDDQMKTKRVWLNQFIDSRCSRHKIIIEKDRERWDDKKDDLWNNYLIWPQCEISKILNMLKSQVLILLTFPFALVVARPSLEVDQTTTAKYCPWPPCYADSWDVDFAEIPLLNETKTQVCFDITFFTFLW